MGIDEVGTLAARKAHRREVVDPAIAAGCPVAASSPGGFRSSELIRKVREALLKAGLPMTTRPPHS
jgi:hypothetical protein